MSFSKRVICNIILLLSLSLITSAQSSDFRKTAMQYITGEQFEYYFIKYDGSPLYNDGKWMKGSVTLISGDEYQDIDLRFDIYRNNLIYFNNFNKSTIVIDDNIIKSFSLINSSGDKEIFKRYKTRVMGQITEKYYSVLVDDSIVLVISHQIKVTDYPSANLFTHNTGKYIYKKKYCIIINHELQWMPKSRHRLYDMFPSIKKDLKQYIRQNHLRLAQQSDLMLIFKEINRLEKSIHTK